MLNETEVGKSGRQALNKMFELCFFLSRMEGKKRKTMNTTTTTSLKLKLQTYSKYRLTVQAFYNQTLSPESHKVIFTPYEDSMSTSFEYTYYYLSNDPLILPQKFTANNKCLGWFEKILYFVLEKFCYFLYFLFIYFTFKFTQSSSSS